MTLKERAAALLAAIEVFMQYAVCPSYGGGACRYCGCVLPNHAAVCEFLVAQQGMVAAMREVEKKLD